MFETEQQGRSWATEQQGWSTCKHKGIVIAHDEESDKFFSLEKIEDQFFWILLP